VNRKASHLVHRVGRRIAGSVAAASVALCVGPRVAPAAAQDIEALSALRGIPLPAAYYERIRQDPDAFELPNGLFKMSPDGPRPAALLEGTARLPVVLALFADSRDPHISRESVARALFIGPAAAGTITAFYEEMSRGRFRVTGDVLPWVRTDVTMAEAVGGSSGLGERARMRDYLIQALNAVDEDVDWTLYDNDGPDGSPDSGDDDGIVDAVAFEFLEIAASCGGPSIWPHRSAISNWNDGGPYFTRDVARDGVPIAVNGYIIQGTTDCSGNVVQTAATIAHEYGHVLGLPDFYHPIANTLPENRRWILGCWELMAAGAWGCGPVSKRVSFGPTHMMAPQKETLGWVQLDRVEGEVWDSEYVLGPIQTSGRALLVPLDSAGIESLILEYRPRVGFDRGLPAEGVLITHRDLRGEVRPRTGYRYRMRVLEADANEALIRTHVEGGNRGEAGDVFGGDGEVRKLNAFTAPALIPNETGRPTTVAIHSIRVSEGRAYVRLSTGKTPRVVPPPGPIKASIARPVNAGVLVAGGLMPYDVRQVSGAPEGVDATALGDQVLLIGAPRAVGSFQVAVRLGDASGNGFEALVPVSVQAFFVEHARLLQAFLRTENEPLYVEEQSYLDGLGNQNGAFDVGDVRAWLLRQ
jgi:M6 family metalloprotease-like protein